MYLVELKPGKEELYRTGDDLALAIRDGDVDARSRIYHRASAKWISITLHPQYKAIIAGQKDEQVSRPARKAWGLLPASLAGGGEEASSSESAPANGTIRHRWKRPTGFGLAGVLLFLGIQLAFSGPRPPWSGRGRTVVIGGERAELSVRPEPVLRVSGDHRRLDMVSLASTSTSWPLISPAAVSDSVAVPLPLPEAVLRLPRAPKLRTKALRAALTPSPSRKTTVKATSVEALLERYEAASDAARGRLERGMRVARLNRLFAPARLTPGGGVTETRRGLAGAANFIRVYRQQQDAIEGAYQDSVALLAKRHKWSPAEVKQWHSRPTRKETPTLELLSGSLLSGIDTLLGVLDAHAGAYKVRGTAIAFEDPAGTQAYGALRRRIKEQIDAAVAAGGATSFGPTGFLLQAIGTSTLPRET
jgi:hypothetical protein